MNLLQLYGEIFMVDFYRLYLSRDVEFYMISNEEDDLCYVLLNDLHRESQYSDFENIDKNFFEPAKNHISVTKIDVADIDDAVNNQIYHFIDGLLQYKPDCDYFVREREANCKLVFDFPDDMESIIDFINENFDLKLTKKSSHFNNLFQD